MPRHPILSTFIHFITTVVVHSCQTLLNELFEVKFGIVVRNRFALISTGCCYCGCERKLGVEISIQSSALYHAGLKPGDKTCTRRPINAVQQADNIITCTNFNHMSSMSQSVHTFIDR